jgi:hypothetical protein
MEAAKMAKIISKTCVLVILALMSANGCTFITTDEFKTSFYGIDERRGSEYLNKVLEKQRQVYQGRQITDQPDSENSRQKSKNTGTPLFKTL